MKTFKCRDAGVNCDWQALAETPDLLMAKIEEHGRKAHKMAVIPNELKEKIQSAIREVSLTEEKGKAIA
jgi:predicted small metal-binding protein